MKFQLILILFQAYSFFYKNEFNSSFINSGNFSIDNAVYIIQTRDGELNLRFLKDIPVFENDKNIMKRLFLIKENNKKKNISYYFIEDYLTKKKLYLVNEENEERIKQFSNLDNLNNIDLGLWIIIPKINSNNQLVYYIQNKFNHKFWEFNETLNNNIKISNTTNINSLNQNNEFQFVRLFRESDKLNSLILKDEPIDVLITYVDLSDKNYVKKTPRIKKEQDNGELKYSVRSILKNIPWIRKIFILMPNEKVSYFKSAEEIKEKIVYVKDKVFLGFDSSSSSTLQFNLHKMKKFGLSENFILMDDDNFIAKPLKKQDLFYEENGKVYPCLISSYYREIKKEKMEKILSNLLTKRRSYITHSSLFFSVQRKKSILFMYKIFGEDNQRYGKKLIEPIFTHNLTPLKLSDIKEVYKYIDKLYPFANETLKGLTRTLNSLQMQTTITTYVINQYNRKISRISSSYYDISQIYKIYKNKKHLFVINTGLKNYSSFIFERARKAMKDLFPNKTKYELDLVENSSNLGNTIINNIIKQNLANKDTKLSENKKKYFIETIYIYFIFFIIIIRFKLYRINPH